MSGPTIHTDKRKRRGPQPFAQEAASALEHHFSARGFGQIELVTRWNEIAGRPLAEHCFPCRLSQAGNSGATLTLVVDDRASLELQHQSPKLIDRINTYFGRAVVNKIKVVAGDVPRSLAPPRMVAPLSGAKAAELERQVEIIEDRSLRDALARLGRHALAESRKPSHYKR